MTWCQRTVPSTSLRRVDLYRSVQFRLGRTLVRYQDGGDTTERSTTITVASRWIESNLSSDKPRVLECRTVVRGCSSAFHRPSPDCGSCANRTVQCSGKELRVSPRVIAMSSRSSVFIRRCSVESGDLQLTAMPSRVSLPGIPVGSTHRSYQSVP